MVMEFDQRLTKSTFCWRLTRISEWDFMSEISVTKLPYKVNTLNAVAEYIFFVKIYVSWSSAMEIKKTTYS